MSSTASTDGAEYDTDRLEADADSVLAELGVDGELSLLVCNDTVIHALNLQYRGKDAPTDVLSFPQDDDVLLGDVVISLDTATRQAADLGHDLDTEVRVLLVHGICHLLGYDHHTDEEARDMRALEDRALGALGLAMAGLVGRASLE